MKTQRLNQSNTRALTKEPIIHCGSYLPNKTSAGTEEITAIGIKRMDANTETLLIALAGYLPMFTTDQ